MTVELAVKMIRQYTEEQTEEEFKSELEQKTINRLRNFLCDHLEPERFFPFLQSKEYLDPESCERIRSAGTTKSRVNKMLDILIRSGPHPLKFLIKAIERNGPTQKFVTDKMKGELERVSRDPENRERLEVIRMQPFILPTRMYGTGQPPPYEPPGISSANSQAGSVYSASTFVYDPSSTGFQGTNIKTPELPLLDVRRNELLQNGSPQHTRFPPQVDSVPKQLLLGRRLPISPSDDSILGRFPSSFQTDDFPPSYDISATRDSEHGHGITLPLEPMTQILSDQHQEEIKISLNATASGSMCMSTPCTTNTHEKEITNNSLTTGTAATNRWALSRRVPSEHDASVVTTRNSPVTMSPTPLSTGNAETASGSSSSTKPLTDESFSPPAIITPTRAKNLKSLMSSQTTSIQPSCFTTSNFENFDSSHLAGTSQDSPKATPAMKSPKMKSSPSQYAHGRPYSTLLEPIPSIEVENSESQICISTRLPPTEHDDTSIVLSNASDDDTSSLEISTDSDISEQQ